MRALFVAVLLLSACVPVVAGVTVGSFPILHRSPADVVVSAIAGLDCSIVYLDMGARYCRPRETPPLKPAFCTRSLGVADCWADPMNLANQPREVADGPRSLTPAQEADRTRQWPGLW